MVTWKDVWEMLTIFGMLGGLIVLAFVFWCIFDD